MNLMDLEAAVIKWAQARGIYDPVHGSTLKDQVLKLGSEFGELCDNANKGRDVRDDIGDCLVVLINCATLAGCTIEECLTVAYNEIKDRKGQMVNGVFIKAGDLSKEEIERNS